MTNFPHFEKPDIKMCTIEEYLLYFSNIEIVFLHQENKKRVKYLVCYKGSSRLTYLPLNMVETLLLFL